MKTSHTLFFLIFGLAASFFTYAETEQRTPYGSGELTVWPDLKEIEQIKVIWDFVFDDPTSVDGALNPVVAVLNAAAEHGRVDFKLIDTVVVSHGPEAVVWAKQNYDKFKDIVDRAAQLAEQGVRFEVCNNVARALGFSPEDLHGFVNAVPSGSLAVVYWQLKGYSVIHAGSTSPVKIVNQFNEGDIKKDAE